jgi:hypothetical protein
MKKKVLAVLLVLFVILVIIAAFYGTRRKTSERGYVDNVLRIAHQRNDVYFSMIPLIMRERGLLEKYLPMGTSVEWTNIDVQTDMRDAVVAGKVDIGILPTSQLVIANASGLPLVPISDFTVLRAGLYSHHGDIKSIDDIEIGTDKISAASFGNASHTSLQIYCNEKYGDAVRYDGNIMPMSYADMWASVESSDDLSASLIAFSDTLRADASDKFELILDLSAYSTANGLGSTALTMTDFYNANPAYVEAYRNASREAVDFVTNNRHEAAELLTKYWDYDVSVIEKELEDLPPHHELSESSYDKLAEFMYEIGSIKTAAGKFLEFPNYDTIPKVD